MGECGFFNMRFGRQPFFCDERKARQDEMFILTLIRPSVDRVRKKMENYAEIFGNMRKEVTIMWKRCQIYTEISNV